MTTKHTPGPNEPIKKFPLRVVLTVTTGHLLTKSDDGRNGIGDLYEILDHMTGDDPYTHQLLRFNEECKTWLLRWYPELRLKIEVWKLVEMIKTTSGSESPDLLIEGWLSGLVANGICAEEYDIGRIPRDDHTVKDPYDELIEMRGTDEGIVIVNHQTGESNG